MYTWNLYDQVISQSFGEVLESHDVFGFLFVFDFCLSLVEFVLLDVLSFVCHGSSRAERPLQFFLVVLYPFFSGSASRERWRKVGALGKRNIMDF